MVEPVTHSPPQSKAPLAFLGVATLTALIGGTLFSGIGGVLASLLVGVGLGAVAQSISNNNGGLFAGFRNAINATGNVVGDTTGNVTEGMLDNVLGPEAGLSTGGKVLVYGGGGLWVTNQAINATNTAISGVKKGYKAATAVANTTKNVVSAPFKAAKATYNSATNSLHTMADDITRMTELAAPGRESAQASSAIATSADDAAAALRNPLLHSQVDVYAGSPSQPITMAEDIVNPVKSSSAGITPIGAGSAEELVESVKKPAAAAVHASPPVSTATSVATEPAFTRGSNSVDDMLQSPAWSVDPKGNFARLEDDLIKTAAPPISASAVAEGAADDVAKSAGKAFAESAGRVTKVVAPVAIGAEVIHGATDLYRIGAENPIDVHAKQAESAAATGAIIAGGVVGAKVGGVVGTAVAPGVGTAVGAGVGGVAGAAAGATIVPVNRKIEGYVLGDSDNRITPNLENKRHLKSYLSNFQSELQEFKDTDTGQIDLHNPAVYNKMSGLLQKEIYRQEEIVRENDYWAPRWLRSNNKQAIEHEVARIELSSLRAAQTEVKQVIHEYQEAKRMMASLDSNQDKQITVGDFDFNSDKRFDKYDLATLSEKVPNIGAREDILSGLRKAGVSFSGETTEPHSPVNTASVKDTLEQHRS